MLHDGDDLSRHWRRAVRRCRAAGATTADAEDAVQQAVLEAIECAGVVGERADLGSWLGVVARRRHVDRLRRATREQRAAAPDDQDRTIRDPAEIVAERSEASFLVAGLAVLPRTTRDVLAVLARGGDKTAAADELGLTVRAVESHLTRTRRALRRAAATEWARVDPCAD